MLLSPALDSIVLLFTTATILLISNNVVTLKAGITINPQTSYREQSPTPTSPYLMLNIQQMASQLYNGRGISLLNANQQQQQLQDQDLFHCVDPTRELFENFVQQYNRTFGKQGDAETLDRLTLFVTTLKRTIMLNRIIQNEILNETNYDLKPERIRNYYFISPIGSDKNALWYSDITDCELGLIKYIIFEIFYLIDKNELATAYKLAIDNSEYLPLLNEDGFEQLANILLVRLYDRFKGDTKMDQLYQWPSYVKKLAAFAYNQRQLTQPDFNIKLPYIVFAYPAYFKDLKYNRMAINRTGDNWKAHNDHEKFNELLGRKFSNLQERNKRLAVFRQRWTFVNLLNENSFDRRTNSWQNITSLPEWFKIQRNNFNTYEDSNSRSNYHNNNRYNSDTTGPAYSVSEKLRLEPSRSSNNLQSLLSDGRFKHTQFSDLTDAEFVAFLTNDFSLLEKNSRESANFIDNNFPIRPLDEEFRNEIALELELRRAAATTVPQQQQMVSKTTPLARDSFLIARKVVDELISDVGLPIGRVAQDGIGEEEFYNVFTQLGSFFAKNYFVNPQTLNSDNKPSPSETELLEERRKRYEIFKTNYGRFKAWFTKEAWNLDETQLIAMLRLSDMSWSEIKLSLFKICCLTEDNLTLLGSQNASIYYLGSNEFMCQQLSDNYESPPISNEDQNLKQLVALELYYYYSVHFNKHHINLETFYKRFEIFKHNLDQIRRFSCTRGLTLYRALKAKRAEALNGLDTLDLRRSFTDDINLDRYRYFSIPNLSSQSEQQLSTEPEGFERYTSNEFGTSSRDQNSWENDERERESSGQTLSRAGISYRRKAFFASLYDKAQIARASQQGLPSTAPIRPPEKLTSEARNAQLNAQRYRANNVQRIYELVMQRYRYCMKTIRGIDLAGNLEQQCQASGKLSDQAANVNSGWFQPTARLTEEDQCAFYRRGLEPWSEGLIPQDSFSPKLIQTAKC